MLIKYSIHVGCTFDLKTKLETEFNDWGSNEIRFLEHCTDDEVGLQINAGSTIKRLRTPVLHSCLKF